jgi:hypothetical protein
MGRTHRQPAVGLAVAVVATVDRQHRALASRLAPGRTPWNRTPPETELAVLRVAEPRASHAQRPSGAGLAPAARASPTHARHPAREGDREEDPPSWPAAQRLRCRRCERTTKCPQSRRMANTDGPAATESPHSLLEPRHRALDTLAVARTPRPRRRGLPGYPGAAAARVRPAQHDAKALTTPS